ncbi:MAG: FAD:protein FMN transferase [Candidatus Aminicenantes bacterium]|nr:FAD:protein FMN transferase [Candidatus Aminicenantes bacterium]
MVPVLSIRSPVRKTAFAGLLLILIGAGCRSSSRWHQYTVLFFDTVCDVQVFCPASQVHETQAELHRVFSAIETHFSPDRYDLSSPAVLELYGKARRLYCDSGGYFDISVGALTRLWGFSTKSYRLPQPEEIATALLSVGQEAIREQAGSLILPPGMILDWGGLAKGWGIDRAVAALRDLGITRGFVNAGGDLFCWGRNPSGSAWRVGIRHPRQAGYLGILSVTSVAVATSGDYQRFFEKNGVRYHHLFDPRTGYPARGKQSVTVVGPEGALCDGLSTALFSSPAPDDILARYPQYGAVIVDAAGNLRLLGKSYPLEIL